MKRSDQTGANAPRKGAMIRQTMFGNAAYSVPAITRFPPPDFLTQTQTNIWIAALSDVPLEFFRARHISMMVQYVRAVEHMMTFSDEFEADPDDMVALGKWERMIRLASRLENHLALNTRSLIDLVVRSRTELRAAHQSQNAQEAGEDSRNPRVGLVYVGH